MTVAPEREGGGLLPAKLLSYSARAGAIVPHYLTARDEVWVREVLGELDAFAGKTAREVDVAFEAVGGRACANGAAPRAVAGLRRVCSRIWGLRTEALIRPSLARRVVFELAAKTASRAEAIDDAARSLGVSSEALVASLFADRPNARRLVSPAVVPSSAEIVGLYNLALVQGLLLSATDVTVHARSHVRSVVRFAKLKGLLCTYDADAHGLRIHLSGPLSVLRHTTKYGIALAAFLPSVIATPGWSLEARCEHQGASRRLVASAADPIASTHALPRDVDSAVERCLLRDIRRLGSTWTMARETTAIRAGGRVFFPDFTLTREGHRVLVEIVGYYTPEYLASKLRTLREAGLTDIVVCVDETLACDSKDVVAPEVLRYRKRVDAKALLAAAERIAASLCPGPSLGGSGGVLGAAHGPGR